MGVVGWGEALLFWLPQLKFCFSEINSQGDAIAGSYGSCMDSFIRDCQTFLDGLCHFTFPPSMYKGSSSFTSSSVFVLSLFYFSRSGRYVVIVHYDFNLYFPNG